MRLKHAAVAVLAGTCCSAARGAEADAVRFAKNPTAARAEDKVKIEFAVTRETDVAVFISIATSPPGWPAAARRSRS